MPEILFKGQKILYTHHINSRLKHIYIRIGKNQEVILKSPKISQEVAQELMLKKGDWILKKLSIVRKNPLTEVNDGSEIQCYDNTYKTVIHTSSDEKGVRLKIEGHTIRIFLKPELDRQTAVQMILEKFYRAQTIHIVRERMPYWSEITGLSVEGLKFRKMKRQWGNCNHKNIITINAKASMLNPDQLDYLLVHEICHIRHKNHSRDFWKLVEKYIPNFRKLDREIKHFDLQ